MGNNRIGMEPTAAERAWLETVPVGAELSLKGSKGVDAFGIGIGNLEWGDYIRVERDHHGVKITRLK